jgi:hypothetical protein
MSTFQFYCVLCGSALEIPSDSQHDLMKCDACARIVPVPRRAKGVGNFKCYPHVFPPDVLELLIKFQCSGCGSKLYADARCEGREAICSGCGAHTRIPIWSNVPEGPRFLEPEKIGPARAAASEARGEVPALSPEELEFLRGARPGQPEAAA